MQIEPGHFASEHRAETSKTRAADNQETQKMMKTVLFNVKEETVARQLGLTREEVKELRVENLYQDEDFAKIGRDLCYTQDAIEKIRQIIKKNAPAGVKLGDLALMKIKAARPPVILDAVVTEVYPHNQEYLEALLGGQTITVHVNSNVNFLPGMIIQSRQLTMKNTRVFNFSGRCPRARGRW